jgi:hypothetical protein
MGTPARAIEAPGTVAEFEPWAMKVMVHNT